MIDTLLAGVCAFLLIALTISSAIAMANLRRCEDLSGGILWLTSSECHAEEQRLRYLAATIQEYMGGDAGEIYHQLLHHWGERDSLRWQLAGLEEKVERLKKELARHESIATFYKPKESMN